MSDESSAKNVGFIGLGSMGFGMATHLIQRRLNVTGYDVQKQTRIKFQEAGGSAANSPRAVVELSQSQVLVVMVATAEQAFDVLFNSDSGADGSLSILFAGAGEVLNPAIQVLDALSAHRFHVPGPLGSAFALKMIHQILVGVHIVAAVETAALAMLAGLDLESLEREVMASNAASWLYGERMPHLRVMDRSPYSSLAIILKDLVYLGNEKIAPTSTSNPTITAETMKHLLIGIHLAAALEAFSLVDALDLDRSIFHRFVLTAAGASKVLAEFKSFNVTDLRRNKLEEVNKITGNMCSRYH
ncbi:hypothetical protein PRZ48_015110 [Zasmidium cellare]|uniref:3-hydroxyisobutyrate dehydrogenase n=1 Tax=Zasmidium cellare TaxID=395010 RepID=A0ABR0DXN7_ZASCE|nr:hypothetical protein PRZ48_015110 [Zasmidium cellare]